MATLCRTTTLVVTKLFSPKPISKFHTTTKCCFSAGFFPVKNSTKNSQFGDKVTGSVVSKRSVLGGNVLRKELGRKVLRFSSGSNGGGSSGNGGLGGAGGNGENGGGGSKSSFLAWYLNLLEKYPVLTKAVTSAILTFVGDVVCQVAIDHVPSVDLKRTLLFTTLGFALVGPTLHFWYLYLSKLVTTSGTKGAFLRLIVDQFLFSPAFIGVFLSTLLTLEGKSSQVVPKLQQEWFSAVVANWQLWIPFQFLNFRFVPQQFQVLAANVIALVWNVILSYKAHKEVIAK